MDNKAVGKRGELLAGEYLRSKNYKIISQNYRAKQYGEVDIIAQKADLLVFVEVKARIGEEFGRPEEAVTPGKLYELKKMVDYYCNSSPNTKLSPQIDVIAVTLNPNLSLKSLEHFENITL